MTKKRTRWFIVLGVIFGIILGRVSLLIYFNEQIHEARFLRKSFISSLANFEIPATAQIVEYRFRINSFGVEPFFAKLELGQEDYEIVKGYFFSYGQEHQQEFFRYYLFRRKPNFINASISPDDIATIGLRDRMTSRISSTGWGSTRVIHSFLITTNDGEHFLYVFYGH